MFTSLRSYSGKDTRGMPENILFMLPRNGVNTTDLLSKLLFPYRLTPQVNLLEAPIYVTLQSVLFTSELKYVSLHVFCFGLIFSETMPLTLQRAYKFPGI